MAEPIWLCSMCRAPINEGDRYYRCSVSSCNSGRMKLRFCSTACWNAHIPTARHRNASYVEETARRETDK
jgi:hypothetical protein